MSFTSTRKTNPCPFYGLGQALKQLNTQSSQAIDSFLVAVCKNIHIARSRLVAGTACHGYNASKKEYFYGFKVQVITTTDGMPVDYFISAGSFAQITAFQAMNLDLPSALCL